MRAPRPTDNMAAGESGPSGTPAPTERFVGADDSVRPARDAQYSCRAGPMCPAGRVRRKAVFGSSGRPTPTERLSIEFRRGRRLDAPPLPTRTITAGWGHPAPAHARGEAPLGGRCKKRERRGVLFFLSYFHRVSRAWRRRGWSHPAAAGAASPRPFPYARRK